MHYTGHLGVSLLVFAPITYALLHVGAPVFALLTGAVMLWFAILYRLLAPAYPPPWADTDTPLCRLHWRRVRGR